MLPCGPAVTIVFPVLSPFDEVLTKLTPLVNFGRSIDFDLFYLAGYLLSA